MPQKRYEGFKNGTYRAITVMEPFISLGLKDRRAYHRGVILSRWRGDCPDLSAEQRKAYYDAENEAVDLINADFYKYAHHVTAHAKGALEPNEAHAFVRYKHVDHYDDLRRDALVDQPVRIPRDEPFAPAVLAGRAAAHRRPAHRLDPARDDHVIHPGQHALRREMRRLLARPALRWHRARTEVPPGADVQLVARAAASEGVTRGARAGASPGVAPRWRSRTLTTTLGAMASGGMYDHLAGGFAR